MRYTVKVSILQIIKLENESAVAQYIASEFRRQGAVAAAEDVVLPMSQQKLNYVLHVDKSTDTYHITWDDHAAS